LNYLAYLRHVLQTLPKKRALLPRSSEIMSLFTFAPIAYCACFRFQYRLFVYPFNSNAKSKSIAVRAEDVPRLDDGEYLNDTLIEFGLKYDKRLA